MPVTQQFIVIIPHSILLSVFVARQYQRSMKNHANEDGIVDGFSSDEELKHEEIIVEERKKTEVEVLHKEEVKFKIPPPQEIKVKSYSLNPDIATGWAPKSELPVPIPMLFDNRRVDSIVKRFLEKKHDKMRLIYLGPRFENTFYAWYNREFEFPYLHIKSPHNMKFTNRAFCGQHWDAEDGPIFDSFFQSGNLDMVVQVGEKEYDIYMRVDSNTRGHLQWFNFKIKNLEKLQKYKFNICNLQKNKSLYSRGQKPFILSAKALQKQKRGWEQAGDSVKFEQKPAKSARVLNCEYSASYKLTFDYYTQYDNDVVQMAYCIPYTYTDLLNHLKYLENRPGAKQFISIGKLCLSLGGLEVPMITIHQNYDQQEERKSMSSSHDATKIHKKCIIISGRVHPGQSNGSHMMHGFLDYLCGDSRQARMLRENFVFKIIPMLNPDGVTLGNYRTGISGRDFNREYRNPEKDIFPQVYAFKKLVIDNKSMYGENLLMFLDFHGHSTKKNVFVYGPQFPIIQRHYYECRVFPKLLGNHTKMFRYYSCSFKVSEFKETTARAIFLRRVMIPLSYTIEASNGSFYDHQLLKDVAFNQVTWEQMGKKIGTALGEYCELVLSSQKFRVQKMLNRRAKRDIKIRKSSKGRSPQSQKQEIVIHSDKQICLLANTEDEKIKKIYEQIKAAEEQKQFMKNQEDDVSEGSSDGQGQKDDLSPQKLNLLFQIIKNKKANISDKHRKRFVEDQIKHSKTNQMQESINNDESLQLDVRPVEIVLPLVEQPQIKSHQQIFKPCANMKGHFLRSKHNNMGLSSEKKKQKIAARIINFSFIGHARPSYSMDKRNGSGNKGEMSEPGSLSKIDKSFLQQAKTKINNLRVLDLSDNSFRQTCTSAITSDSISGLGKLGDRNNKTFFNVSPRKLGAAKLQQYKYKRLFIDDFKI